MVAPAAPSVMPRSDWKRGSASGVGTGFPLERPWLRASLTVLCGYEFLALTTRRVPTVSAGMWRLRPSERAVVWCLAAFVLSDHFFTRRLT